METAFKKNGGKTENTKTYHRVRPQGVRWVE